MKIIGVVLKQDGKHILVKEWGSETLHTMNPSEIKSYLESGGELDESFIQCKILKDSGYLYWTGLKDAEDKGLCVRDCPRVFEKLYLVAKKEGLV